MSNSQFLKQIFIFIFIFLHFISFGVNAQETNKIYWTDISDNSRPWRISLNPLQSRVLRLKAEIPAEKNLKAYNFILTYDTSIISVTDVKRSQDSVFPPLNINVSTPGTIICNSFNTSGLDGEIFLSLLDVTITGISTGKFNFDIKVNNFGSSGTDQFIPESDNLEVLVTNNDIMVEPGDINDDGVINLIDEILAAQIMSGIIPVRSVYQDADVNADNKIGIQEMIYILKKLAQTQIAGDVNSDNFVDLKDAVISLQVLCSKDLDQNVNKQADVNKDGKIGIQESIYVLRKISGL